jgi:hypothetical protein
MEGQPAGNSGALSGTPPGLRLAGLLGQAAGPGKRYACLDDDGTVVAAGRWDALESWCVSQKLAAVRELIRRNPAAGHETEGGLPGAWRDSLTEEIALELGITKTAAGALINLAWTLERRLPLTAAALDDGILNLGKARMMADETAVLSDADAGKAEALVAGSWAGKTWSQLRAKIARAVVQIDPDGTQKRREQAEKDEARVRFWREHAGTAGLAGYGLPTDQALKAHQNIQHRARAYKRWGIPEPMDLLRVMAMLDLLNGTDARHLYPKTPAGQHNSKPGHDTDGQHGQDDGRDDGRDDDGRDAEDGPEDGGGEPGNGGDGGLGDGPAGNGADDGLPANLDMTIPMLSLLGLAQRPGEAHGLGVLDPGLARRLAAEAAKNPRSSFGIIVTDPEGRAIGYAKATRARRPKKGRPARLRQDRAGGTRDGTTVTFTRVGPGPPDGYGTWVLTLGDLVLTVKLAPIPDGECDHRYESAGYQPSDTLRRLVQIRDGECVLPVCVRHPKGCDFDHAVPWPEGRTCSCNGGCRCPHDHRIKHSPGWKAEQLPGGYHRWTTPSGRSYTKGPREYPI